MWVVAVAFKKKAVGVVQPNPSVTHEQQGHAEQALQAEQRLAQAEQTPEIPARVLVADPLDGSPNEEDQEDGRDGLAQVLVKSRHAVRSPVSSGPIWRENMPAGNCERRRSGRYTEAITGV